MDGSSEPRNTTSGMIEQFTTTSLQLLYRQASLCGPLQRGSLRYEGLHNSPDSASNQSERKSKSLLYPYDLCVYLSFEINPVRNE